VIKLGSPKKITELMNKKKSKSPRRGSPKKAFKPMKGPKKKIELETIISGVQGNQETPFSQANRIARTNPLSPLAASR
jgi:hypothetical protein